MRLALPTGSTGKGTARITTREEYPAFARNADPPGGGRPLPD
jgi:hypothetical protein